MRATFPATSSMISPSRGDLIAELDIPNLKLQFDIYHCQIIHGDVTMRLREMMPLIGHVQIASIPSRNEPDGEELELSVPVR